MKKTIALILVFVFMLGMMPAAFAASDEAIDAANELNKLGLFQGVGTNEDGTPIFDLDRAPTRAEAVTMLVRLLGKETEAKNGQWQMPFIDVPDWAKPYVGYAYENKLTNGVSATEFGGASTSSATQYLTFVLRSLGYSSGTDFQWDKAWELTDKLGITQGEYDAENNSSFLRSNIVLISVSALSATINGATLTLAEKMIEDGVFTEEQYTSVMGLPEQPQPPAEIEMTIGSHQISYLPTTDSGRQFDSFHQSAFRINNDGLLYEMTFVDKDLSPKYVFYSKDTQEPYTYQEDGLDLIFQSYLFFTRDEIAPHFGGMGDDERFFFTDNTEFTPFTTGSDVRSYKGRTAPSYDYSAKDVAISENAMVTEITIGFNGKEFHGMSAADVAAANLTSGTSGTWDGVGFYFRSDARNNNYNNVFYNMNDLARYFGIDRSFHVWLEELDPEYAAIWGTAGHGYWIIDDKSIK